MTVPTFYRCSLAAPIVLPLLSVAFVWTTGIDVDQLAWPIEFLLYLLAFSLIYGSLPYLVLALWAGWFITNKTEAQIRRLFVALPLLMAGLVTIVFLLIGAGNASSAQRREGLAVVAAGASILLGYLYVMLTFVLRRCLTLKNG